MTQQTNVIRQQNLNRLQQFMFTKDSAFKAEMAQETALSVVTINSLVKQLLEANVLLEGEAVQQTLGRPAIKYHFNYDLQHDLLISIQEEKKQNKRQLVIHAQILNLKAELKYQAQDDFIEVTLDYFAAIIQQYLQKSDKIASIALSIPGKVYEGKVVSSWEDLFDGWDFELALAEMTDVPVRIQNGAHLVTIGYSLTNDISLDDTIVGIFHPENSMPGISIYSNGQLVDGRQNLAGEAKYLPHLLQNNPPNNPDETFENLLMILAIYNAVIAPDAFIISAPKVSLTQDQITQSTLQLQINTPDIYFVDDFQESMMAGLHWLAIEDESWKI